MDYFVTYQQADTLKLKSLKDISLQAQKPSALDAGRAKIKALPERADSIEQHRRQEINKEKQNAAPIRIVQRPRAEVLHVDSSVYIKPQANNALELKPEVAIPEVVLPVKKLNRVNYDWLTLVLIFALIVFATVKIPFAKYIAHLFKATVNYPTSVRMFRERSYSLVDGAFRLDVFFYAIFPVFIYQAFAVYEVDFPVSNLSLFLFCFLAVLAYFSIKKILYLMVGGVNNSLGETLEYIFNLNNYNRVLAMFLFPVVAILAFSPVFNPRLLVFAGLIFTVVIYGMTLQRGALILLKKHFSIFYLFLYLCTLEFLPLLLLFKIVLV